MFRTIDTAILALPIPDPTFTEVPLFTEEFLLVRPRKDASATVPDANELRHMRLLLLEEGHCFRDQALAFCNIQSAAPREGLDGSSLSTLVQLVGAGIGVTLIPEMAEDVETQAAAVATARLRDPKPKRTVGMVWRKSNPLAGELIEMAAIARELSAGSGHSDACA